MYFHEEVALPWRSGDNGNLEFAACSLQIAICVRSGATPGSNISQRGRAFLSARVGLLLQHSKAFPGFPSLPVLAAHLLVGRYGCPRVEAAPGNLESFDVSDRHCRYGGDLVAPLVFHFTAVVAHLVSHSDPRLRQLAKSRSRS